MELDKQTYMMQKLLGLTGRMRKFQKTYFKSRMDYDKRQAIKYEKLVDEYLQLMVRSGYNPIFDEDIQSKLL
jgi:hypothetical protein